MILLFERKEVDVKMLTYEQAKKIGQEACIDRLGRDFVMKYRDTSCPAFSDLEDHADCFVGVDNSENRYGEGKPIMLTSGYKWPYSARCTVRYADGKVEFLECVSPQS